MSSGDALLQRIHDNPGDDVAREVYADWLSEQGDPRGEFIALQCARRGREPSVAEEQREEELIALHSAEWFEPFGPLMTAVRFDRGFLSSCRLTAVPDAAIGDPCWSMLQRVFFADGVHGEQPAAFVSHPSMRALRDVIGLPDEALVALCQPEMDCPVERLELPGPRIEAASVALASGRGLSRLQRVSLPGPLGKFADVVRLMLGVRTKSLVRVDAQRWNWDLIVDRTDAGLTSLEARARVGAGMIQIENLVRSLVPTGLTALKIVVPQEAGLDRANHGPLRVAIEEHRRLTQVELPPRWTVNQR